MEQVNIKKALIQGGVNAGVHYFQEGELDEMTIQAALRGGLVSIGSDVVGSMIGLHGAPDNSNVFLDSMVAGMLSAGVGRFQDEDSNLTQDFFWGAIANMSSEYLLDWWEGMGGDHAMFPALTQRGVNLV